MPKYLALAARAILSPERIIKKIADVAAKCDGKEAGHESDKFFIDSNGSMVLNRNNVDVQKAFAANVKGLSTKKKG
ncbi:hypothetical protein I5476_09395 [Citrobacter braakii]|uniref:hypothetical protein n=1 Tax=Citrobacter freundii complex TaxID=1344959 RepID=UPI001904BAB3|nr:hypothetical protein [Citrobacter braakii]MBJ9144268.1 hypothetical protein [Citrobacter braakii]